MKEFTDIRRCRKSTLLLQVFKKNFKNPFLKFKKGKLIELIQVCYDLTPENLDRETKGLMEAMEFFKVKEGKIITLKQTETFNINSFKINVIAAKDYLIM